MKDTSINKKPEMEMAFNVAPTALFIEGVSGWATNMSSLRDFSLVKVRRTDRIIEVNKPQKHGNPEGVTLLHHYYITPLGFYKAWMVCVSIILSCLRHLLRLAKAHRKNQ